MTIEDPHGQERIHRKSNILHFPLNFDPRWEFNPLTGKIFSPAAMEKVIRFLETNEKAVERLRSRGVDINTEGGKLHVDLEGRFWVTVAEGATLLSIAIWGIKEREKFLDFFQKGEDIKRLMDSMTTRVKTRRSLNEAKRKRGL